MLFIPTASECALGKCGHWYMNMGLKHSNEVRIGKLTLTTDKYMHFQKVKQKGVLSRRGVQRRRKSRDLLAYPMPLFSVHLVILPVPSGP